MKKIFILSLIFFTGPTFGYYTDTVPNACGTFYNLNAVFEQVSYTCASGYFLPANSTTCAVCPSGYTCGGGTFYYNNTQSQGLVRVDNLYTTNETNACAANFAHNFNAVFELAGYTCASGTYLPKNTTTCAACPNGYTCGGGTYSLDVNNDQGIVGNTITVIWNGATAEDIAANNAGTVTYGGDIRTPVRPDPSQIPIGKRFVGLTFRKTSQN